MARAKQPVITGHPGLDVVIMEIAELSPPEKVKLMSDPAFNAKLERLLGEAGMTDEDYLPQPPTKFSELLPRRPGKLTKWEEASIAAGLGFSGLRRRRGRGVKLA